PPGHVFNGASLARRPRALLLRTAIARPVLMSPGEPGFVASNQSFLVVAIQSAPADEIRGIVDAAAADILRLARIGAKRTGAIDHSPRHVRSDDSIGCDSALDPVLQGPEHIEVVRT